MCVVRPFSLVLTNSLKSAIVKRCQFGQRVLNHKGVDVKIFSALVFVMCCGILPAQAEVSSTVIPDGLPPGYTFQIDKAFRSSDHGITVRFYADGPNLKFCPNGTGTCMQTFIAMRVDGKLNSAGLSVIDEPRPYLLYNFQDDEYEKIAGLTKEVIVYIFEKPYRVWIAFGIPE